MIRIVQHPSGRRVYVLKLRVHHGAVGLALIAAGAVLLAHDRADFPFNDHCNH